jgi:hypothetical protein
MQMLLSLATSLNSVPLPPVSNRFGIRLPPAEHCLTNVNFAIVPDPPPQVAFGDSIVQPPVPATPASEAKEGIMGDASMQDANEPQGTKRALEEDEDYD